jgi:hypothetical protein
VNGLTGGKGAPPVRERELRLNDSAGPIGSARHGDRRRVARWERIVERVIQDRVPALAARIRSFRFVRHDNLLLLGLGPQPVGEDERRGQSDDYDRHEATDFKQFSYFHDFLQLLVFS